MSNYTHHKMWDEITYSFQNFNDATHTLKGVWLLIHVGI